MSDYPTTPKAWLAKLVSFDTVSSKSNLDLLRYVEGYLKALGIKSTYIYNAEKTHANLLATLPASNGATQGGIILSGHTDVVPVDGQRWDSDPFVLTERDGKLYGRGAADMKCFLAVCLALTPQFLAMKKAKPIHFAFTFDEEVGCAGVPLLTKWLKAQGFKADCCLVGDGDFIVRTGSKGVSSWKVTVHGKAIHSSMALMNTSCNAIEYAAQIIAKIRAMAIRIRKTDKRDPSYTCPFSSMSVGTIKGGNAVNTVPAECEFIFSIRVTETALAKRVEAEVQQYINETILPAMREEYPEASVEMVPEWDAPAFNADEKHPFTLLLREMVKDFALHKTAGATEAGSFEDGLGVPTVICGPGGARSHMPNEYTEVSRLDSYSVFLTALLQRVVGEKAASLSRL